MLSKIRLTYDKENSNNTKFIIDDGTNQKIIRLSVYYVLGSWYVDISDNENYLLYGKIINTWVDLFELLKIHYKDFPDLKLMALPSNIQGINKNFVEDLPGVLQEIYLLQEDA